MTEEELVSHETIQEMEKFLLKILSVVERWNKIMTLEEGDVMSPLIFDKLLKSITNKLDTFL